MDGDERVETGSLSPSDHDVLVIEGLGIAVCCRVGWWVAGSIRDLSAHGAGGGVPLGESPVDDPLVVPPVPPVLELEVFEPPDAVEPV